MQTTKGRGNAPCLHTIIRFHHSITMTKSDQRRYPPLTLKVAISRLKFWADKVAELAERPPAHPNAVDTINDSPEE